MKRSMSGAAAPLPTAQRSVLRGLFVTSAWMRATSPPYCFSIAPST